MDAPDLMNINVSFSQILATVDCSKSCPALVCTTKYLIKITANTLHFSVLHFIAILKKSFKINAVVV